MSKRGSFEYQSIVLKMLINSWSNWLQEVILPHFLILSSHLPIMSRLRYWKQQKSEHLCWLMSCDHILISAFCVCEWSTEKVSGYRNQLGWWSRVSSALNPAKTLQNRKLWHRRVISALICGEQTYSHQRSPSAITAPLQWQYGKPSTYCIWAVASCQRKCNMH